MEHRIVSGAGEMRCHCVRLHRGEDLLESIRKVCREKDILLIIDEVQTGIGRTGTLFAFQQYGIEPDEHGWTRVVIE